jgi:hypothetical protein
MFELFLTNVLHNLFKPLLLFFYAGFLIPIFQVKFEFPKAVYQGLTIYLLLSIGWKGGEELAGLPPAMYMQAAGFMLLGFCVNALIGFMAYAGLRSFTNLRTIDAATVAGYYGSDSAGTFVTCLGVLTAAHIAYAPFMPVMLAIMEIPGCLVALYIVSKLRARGMDAQGNLPGEPGYAGVAAQSSAALLHGTKRMPAIEEEEVDEEELVTTSGGVQVARAQRAGGTTMTYTRTTERHRELHHKVQNPERLSELDGGAPNNPNGEAANAHREALAEEDALALRTTTGKDQPAPKAKGIFNKELLHEVFMNPGIFLLFAGITIGFVSQLQGESVTRADDALFVNLFQGLLCLFLLEMGMTASKKIKDLRKAGWQFVLFALVAPNLFATVGMLSAYTYSNLTGFPLDLGTYVLFAVLCGAASYIALPAVQRMAIPEASPTLPLAASLGVTFSYNVTVGIPFYIVIATLLTGKAA